MASVNSIEDEVELQKMVLTFVRVVFILNNNFLFVAVQLSAAKDPEERKIIRTRLLEVKKTNSEKREKERVQREQRRDDDIKRRSQAQVEENLQRMKIFEETAKSFGTKIETQADKLKEQALKDKQAYIEKERKAELARIETSAKQHLSASIGEDRNEAFTKQRQQWAVEDKKVEDKNLKDLSKFTSNTMSKQ
ncbi:unnamed protein product [Rotaria magnacalcarata]|uniref:Uncharacterized protein n=1 Tax=Rotaria magnacalcarata TaxID=392030 RepID=A0A820E9W1_9BILA|nr:unnamed protein product [Rotaria magnacalcarata]CAF3902577.1 unnamed protein product [Rotaria magnacalcarata]CAF3911480.1 unnamed protein product [Rotaria magnacalcarata]CAF4138755.1 unnamed protein product [Rotaria magnacalcarata]CAF4245089.1 unnamed protein product [Rotaria magnacalcarata]